MTEELDPAEYFARETLDQDEPSHVWGLVDLEDYAKAQHETIVHEETTLAPLYWRLGRALELIKKQRGRGAWGRYLDSLGIHRVRACKARAIARCFSTADAVTGMAVEAAYEESKSEGQRGRTASARRQQRKASAKENPDNQDVTSPPCPQGASDVAAFLVDTRDRADALLDTAALLESEERATLFPTYRETLNRLRYLGRMLGVDDALHVDHESQSDNLSEGFEEEALART